MKTFIVKLQEDVEHPIPVSYINIYKALKSGNIRYLKELVEDSVSDKCEAQSIPMYEALKEKMLSL